MKKLLIAGVFAFLSIRMMAAPVVVPHVKMHKNFMGATRTARELHRIATPRNAAPDVHTFALTMKRFHRILYRGIPGMYEGNDFSQQRAALEAEYASNGPSADLLARAKAWRKNVLAALNQTDKTPIDP